MDDVGKTFYSWWDERNGNFDIYATGIIPKRPRKTAVLDR
jgi:hypothetical protein